MGRRGGDHLDARTRTLASSTRFCGPSHWAGSRSSSICVMVSIDLMRDGAVKLTRHPMTGTWCSTLVPLALVAAVVEVVEKAQRASTSSRTMEPCCIYCMKEAWGQNTSCGSHSPCVGTHRTPQQLQSQQPRQRVRTVRTQHRLPRRLATSRIRRTLALAPRACSSSFCTGSSMVCTCCKALVVQACTSPSTSRSIALGKHCTSSRNRRYTSHTSGIAAFEDIAPDEKELVVARWRDNGNAACTCVVSVF